MKEDHKHFISISPKSVALFTLIPLGLFFLWFVRDIIFSLLIGFILMSALKPGVVLLTKRKIPRTGAVFIVYITFILLFTLLISLIIPPIIYETTNLIKSLPSIIEDIAPQLRGYVDVKNLTSYIPSVTNNIVDIIFGVFSNTIFVVTTLFFGLYFLLEEDLFQDFICRYCPESQSDRIVAILHKAEERMSSWFWGEITLMTVVGVMTYIGLKIIGIKYALPLAVLAGLLEIVPNIGPIISAIPAVIIGLSVSPLTGLSTTALYIIIQQLENSLIVPYIMKKAVGLNPILTLIALLIGGRIGGVLGVLLSIPLLLFAETVFSDIFNFKLPTGNKRE